jgi:hypothetical protein
MKVEPNQRRADEAVSINPHVLTLTGLAMDDDHGHTFGSMGIVSHGTALPGRPPAHGWIGGSCPSTLPAM